MFPGGPIDLGQGCGARAAPLVLARAGSEGEKTQPGRHIDSLTAREAEVARAVLRGLLNKQIAHELGISRKTVEIHRHNAMEEMGPPAPPTWSACWSRPDGRGRGLVWVEGAEGQVVDLRCNKNE